MKKSSLLLALILLSGSGIIAQTLTKRSETPGGKFMLGMRTTVSAFSDEGSTGTGVGGQFRIRLLKKVNTEWFADYIKSDVKNGLANRSDGHIGWSVMFYMLDPDIPTQKLQPYLLGGHCFDYTRVQSLQTDLSRWSSAVHMGAGTHIRLTEKADISLATQYMIHLGDDIVAEDVHTDQYGFERLVIKREDLGLEGHLFISLSVNLLIADLW